MADDVIEQCEPAFARGCDGRLYRLQYQGMYRWSLHASGPKGVWESLEPTTFDELMSWGWMTRRAGDPQLPRALGIRLTGFTTRRHRLLGCDARCLGLFSGMEGSGAWGRYVMTSVHAETAFDGTIRVWVSRLDMGMPEHGTSVKTWKQSGFTSRRGIDVFLETIEAPLPVLDDALLKSLLDEADVERIALKSVARLG